MKPEFIVASHLNNYLKKGVLVIVAFMLLTIPNMNVYSFIGSYQNSSPAITANTKHKRTYIKDRLFFETALSIGSILGVVVGLIIGGVVYAVVTEDIGKSNLPPNRIDKNYMKYDFSQFDNQK